MKPLEPKSLFARRYEVVRCISTGGMGAVYEVIHLDTKRRRALKVMLPNLLVDDEMRRRFALEAVITANVSSEHLIEVFDAGIEADSGCPFLAMELLDGQDLGKQLAAHGPLSLAEVVELLRQAARALDRTHAAGIVHRDLKPENLFVTRRDDGSPKIKILDFGIAKLLATQGGPSTRALGTPLFMAPEQVDDTLAPVGPTADLYAVAQIAFAMLVGTPYFSEDAKRSDNILGVLLAVAKGTSEPASARAEKRGVSMPAGFDAWFARATAREPSDRWQSARELIDALAVVSGQNPDFGPAPRQADELAVTGKSADASKPSWAATELIPQPAAAAPPGKALPRPAGVDTSEVRPIQTPANSARPESSPPPIAASNTASLDPTVTSSGGGARKARAPLLIALALPAALAIGYVAIDRTPTPISEPRPAGGRATLEATSAGPTSAPSSSAPEVRPTTAQPIAEASASVAPSAEPKPSSWAKAGAEKRPGVLPKASVAPPGVATSPTNLPWEVRTPVKQP